MINMNFVQPSKLLFFQKNQVDFVFNNKGIIQYFLEKKPSLGLAWSSVVSTRIMVSATEYCMPIEQEQQPIKSAAAAADHQNDVIVETSRKVIGRVKRGCQKGLSKKCELKNQF